LVEMAQRYVEENSWNKGCVEGVKERIWT